MPPPKKVHVRAPNPIRQQREIRGATPTFNRPPVKQKPKAGGCPNPECTNSDIHDDGICRGCGTVCNDGSDIVPEVQFADDGQGRSGLIGQTLGEGAVVAHSSNPTLRRILGNAGAGGSSREGTIALGKEFMINFAGLLHIDSNSLAQGLQIFRLAASSNFIQGRRIDMVAAVCLYSACRKNPPCKVMLIDFAEIIKVNVYKLGHTFKSLHRAITFSKEEWAPVIPEDLMYRFAMKLEFKDDMSKVANTACKIAKQMSIDWMAMGRRPSGVCGACIILAARMHNYRRTVTEVVYVVKVTTATLNKRLDEFKMIPASTLSVAEFMTNEPDPSAAAHDPPSYYEKQEEFIKNKKTKKRKRRGELMQDDDDEEDEGGEEADSNKRQKTPATSTEVPPTVELRRDADGFAIPPQPPRPRSHDVADETDLGNLIDETAENPTINALQKIASRIVPGEPFAVSDDEDDDEEGSSTNSASTGSKRNSTRKPAPEIPLPETWTEDEEEISNFITSTLADPKLAELISDPSTSEHARLYEMAEKKAKKHMEDFQLANASKNVRDEAELLEDEFADDPEVQNCLLSPEDVARKEQVWINDNKAWLRTQQLKLYQKRLEASGPPKKKRNRKKMVRIGEGQTEPALSAKEAAQKALKTRNPSKKVNYHALEHLFDEVKGLGAPSAATSRATSIDESDDEDEADEHTSSQAPKPSTSDIVTQNENLIPLDESDNEDDYYDEEEAEAVDDSWKNQGNRGIDEGGEEEDDYPEEDDYANDMNEIDVFGDD